MINNRREAAGILGIPEDADEKLIKKAYKSMAKAYHPDSGNVTDSEDYHQIRQAYEYLCSHPLEKTEKKTQPDRPPAEAKVYGNPSRNSSNYADFNARYEARKRQKAADFEQKMADFEEEQQRQQAAYDEAMSAINAIRLAEAIKAVIRDQNKDE